MSATVFLLTMPDAAGHLPGHLPGHLTGHLPGHLPGQVILSLLPIATISRSNSSQNRERADSEQRANRERAESEQRANRERTESEQRANRVFNAAAERGCNEPLTSGLTSSGNNQQTVSYTNCLIHITVKSILPEAKHDSRPL